MTAKRLALVAAVLAGSLATPLASAQPTPAAPVYRLAAQPLSDALAELARQAGMQLLLPAELVQGRVGRPVADTGDLQQALNELLRESGLRGRVDGRTLVVERVPTAAASEAVLTPVRATAVAETATGPVQGYRATRSATGTRTDVPLIDTPLSIQVVPRELIEDQKAPRLQDALANVSGVYAAHGPDGNTMDAFMVRGFRTASYGSVYSDGTKDFSRAPKETANLERVEVLKGPAALMYGRIEPGGMINQVTKRPLAERFTAVDQEVGSYNHYRTTVDSTGAIDAAANWLYRVNVAAVDEDGFKNDTHNRRLFISPQVEWRPNTDLTVRAAFDYLKDKRSWALTYGTIGDPNGPVDIPIETNLHGKDDFYEEESGAVRLDLSYRLNETWQLQQRASYANRNSVARGSLLSAANLAGDYTRTYWGWEGEDSRVISTNLELVGKFKTGGVKHTLLVGADYYDERYDSGGWSSGGTPANSNVHAPVYDEPYRLNYTTQPYNYSNRNKGLFVQDQVAMFDDRLHLLIGLRRDDADYVNTFATTTNSADDKKNTWRAGLLYKLLPTLSVYTSYVTGFGASQFGAGGSVFPPQTSHQWEIGSKWEPSSDLSVTVATYELVKDNLTMADPNDPTLTILAGEATSKGLEIDIAGRPLPNLEFVASYAYTDVKYTNSGNGLTGERMIGVPRHGASLWGTYRFGATGWRAGAGVIKRSSMLGVQRAQQSAAAPYPYTLDGYTLVNAMVGYDFKLAGYEARAQFNVRNLTDERYNPTTYGGAQRIGLGEPRTFVGSLGLRF